MSQFKPGQYVRVTEASNAAEYNSWVVGLHGEVVAAGYGAQYNVLVAFPEYVGSRGHNGGPIGKPGVKHWWVDEDKLELLPLQKGDRVTIHAPKDVTGGKRGTVTRYDFEELYPYWVFVDGDDLSAGDSCFDASELVKVVPAEEQIVTIAPRDFFSICQSPYEDDSEYAAMKAFEEPIVRENAIAAAQEAFGIADASAQESDDFVVTDAYFADPLYFDGLTEAVDEADQAAAEIPNETFVVWKKVYEVRRDRHEVVTESTSRKAFK